MVLDANGTPVPGIDATDEAIVAYFATRVPAAECPHYIAHSEALAGYTTCERCGLLEEEEEEE